VKEQADTQAAARQRRYRQRLREGLNLTEWLIEAGRLPAAMAGDAAARERAKSQLVGDWIAHLERHGSGVAARGASAADGDAGGRVS
jgi:hypothetical protein